MWCNRFITRALDLQQGEVSHRTETAEALPDNAPFALAFGIVGSETASDRFAVPDNIIRAEMLQVLGLLDCVSLQSKGASRDS